MISSNPSTQWFNTRNMPKVPCWWCHFDCLPAWVFVAAAWLLARAIVSARRRKARPVAWYRWVLHSEWRPFFLGGGEQKWLGPRYLSACAILFCDPGLEVLKCWSVLCFGFSEEFLADTICHRFAMEAIGHRQALLNDFFLGLGLQMARRICGDPQDLPWDPTKEEAIHHDTSLWWEINSKKSKTQLLNFRFSVLWSWTAGFLERWMGFLNVFYPSVFLSKMVIEANCLACNRITKGVAAIQVQSWPALFPEPCDWSPALHLSLWFIRCFFLKLWQMEHRGLRF